jgi:hypothetical protein
MSSIRIKEIKTTLEIDQESAQLLVDALLSYANSLTKDRDGCKCSFCENPQTRAKKILDVYFEAYPLSKVARHAIGIPTLKDIEDRLATHKPNQTKDQLNTKSEMEEK